MTGKCLRLLAAAGFAAAVLLPAGGALADQCGKSHRAAPPSCVTWWYEGDWDWYKGSWHYKKAYAKNNCEGEMVLKIDIAQGGSDDRWHLDYGEEKRETYGKYIRDVRCCTRMGDGCNQKRLTDTSCEDNYRESSAAETCEDETFSQSGANCSIAAACDAGYKKEVTECYAGTCVTARLPVRISSNLDVKVIDAAKVTNCAGYLENAGC